MSRKVIDRLRAARQDRATELLEVVDLKTHFRTERGTVRAVDGVSFTLERGKTLGVVGESGSGKTVLSRSIMGLLPEAQRRARGQRPLRGPRDRQRSQPTRCATYWGTQMAMVFQDPMTSLNPVMKIGKQITESLRLPPRRDKDDARARPRSRCCSRCGIPEPERRLERVPAPAVGRHAPARHDRDRAGVRPEAALRRRAHHRARRDRAGADPRPAAASSSASATWR